MDVLVFGGTSEGRQLVEWLDARGRAHVLACTATEYGAKLLEGHEHVTPILGPLSWQDKCGLMEYRDIVCIVDATHPYAMHISESIAKLGAAFHTDVVRVVRDDEDDVSGDWTRVESVSAAGSYLATASGNILLTTGSKDLKSFARALADTSRLYVRVLPVPSALEQTAAAGISTSHVIAMQGPFSQQLNSALIREFDIEHLVTKQSGKVGGFAQKVLTAQECGIELVVVERPRFETGYSLDDAKVLLEERYGL